VKIKIVSGYVPLSDNHRRSHEEFMALGARLEALPFSKRVFFGALENCWLYAFLKSVPNARFFYWPDQTPRDGVCIQQQKLMWMLQARQEDPETDIFVWIDYGIMHCYGVTEECISAMLHRVEQSGSMDEIVMPGCWDKGNRSDFFMDNNSSPCWRFCGGVVICPRSLVGPFAIEAAAESKQNIIKTNTIGWEVNSWARIERANILPIRWYSADHNNTMFDNYQGRP
jgi:hypothetical protein